MKKKVEELQRAATNFLNVAGETVEEVDDMDEYTAAANRLVTAIDAIDVGEIDGETRRH